MIELTKEETPMIFSLCKGRQYIINMASTEGIRERIWADQKVNPSYAVILAADYAFLLGSMEEPENTDVLRSVLLNCKRKIIVTEEKSWISIISRYYPDTFKRFSRYAFKQDPTAFQKEQLKEYIQIVKPNLQIVQIDESLYYKVLEDPFMADCCSNFSSLEDFMEHGLGFVIIKDDRIITGASSYSYDEGIIDITIGTHLEYRRKGLALACAAKLILECLNRNIYPSWNAANLESVALAQKLGYQLESEYEVYSI